MQSKALKNKCILAGFSVSYRPTNAIVLYFHYNKQEFIVILTREQLTIEVVLKMIKLKCSMHNIPFQCEEKLIKKIEKVLKLCRGAK